ncbi:MAG: diguanylate cyclase [Acidobacteriota bacterium]
MAIENLLSNPRRRGILALVIAVTLVTMVAVQGIERAKSAQRMVGVAIEQSPVGGIHLLEVVAGGGADTAGLLPGDRVQRIGSRLIGSVTDWDRAAGDFERDQPVTFEVEREGQTVQLEVRPGADADWFGFSLLCLAVAVYLSLILVVLMQWTDRLRAKLLLLLALAIATEMALPTLSIGNHLLSNATLCLFYLLTGLEIGLELHLASVIPARSRWLSRRPWLVPLYYVLGLGAALAATLTYLIEEIATVNLFPWTSYQAERLLLTYGVPLWAIAVASILIVQTLSFPDSRGRRQAALVLAGVLPWVAFVFLTTPWVMTNDEVNRWLRIEPLILLCYPLAVFVAIFRYHLLDIELAVRRSLVYTILTGSLLLFFYSSLGAGGALVSQLVGEDGSIWVISGATLILGLLFTPLRRFLHRSIGRRFFPERDETRARLVTLAAELPAEGKLPLMGERLVDGLGEIFAARSVAVCIGGPVTDLLATLASEGPENHEPPSLLSVRDGSVLAVEKAGRTLPASQLMSYDDQFGRYLRVSRAELVVPLSSRERLIGLIVLGGSQAPGGYSSEQVELLDLLSHHVASVLENARLFESATYENLTGLLRREAILEKAAAELDRALRYDRPLTIGIADLDHFKGINDRFGHLAGDGLLKRLAYSIEDSLRHTDAVGRYGGEEFLLVLPETDLEASGAVAEKLLAAVRETGLPIDDECEARVTVSIGLASLAQVREQIHEPSIEDLIAAADHSLYRAKEAGRNRIFPPVRLDSAQTRGATIRA